MNAAASIKQNNSGNPSPRRSAGGYLMWYHDYLERDRLAAKVSGLVQFIAIMYVLRKTEGLERDAGTPIPEYSEPGDVSAKTVALAASCDEATADAALTDCCEHGLLHRKKSGRGYIYKALKDNWRELEDYEVWRERKLAGKPRRKPPQAEVSALVEEEPPEETKPNDPVDTAHPIAIVRPEKPLTLRPEGPRFQPIPLPCPPRKLGFVGTPGSRPLTITRAEVQSGTLWIHWSSPQEPPKAKQVKGEETANHTPCGHGVSRSTFTDSKELAGSTTQNLRCPPTPPVKSGFLQFQAACVECKLPFNDLDLSEAQRIWAGMDLQERIAAVKGLYDRLEAGEFHDPAFLPLAHNYLKKRIWLRPVRRQAQQVPRSLEKASILLGALDYTNPKGRR